MGEPGITNGQDMLVAFVCEKWPGPTAEAMLVMADVGERRREYGSSRMRINAWWVWTVVRARGFLYKR